jgi:hypothetical protein
MLHGRFFSRSRSALRWTLFLALLASMAAGAEALWPPQPRWVLRQPLNVLGYSHDGRVFVTAQSKPTAERWEEYSAGPVQVRDVAGGHILGSFFAGAIGIKSFHSPPCYANTAMLGVQPLPGASWQIHLLDLSSLATRKLQFELQPNKSHGIACAPILPLAAILQSEIVGDKIRNQELSLVDLETSKVIERWNQGTDHIEPVVSERFLFYAHAANEIWTVFCWDLQEQRIRTIEESAHGVHVSENKRFAVTSQKQKDDQQRLKLWDLSAGTIVAECVTGSGEIQLAANGIWAWIVPEKKDASVEFWNLRTVRRLPHADRGDWSAVLSANGRPVLATHAPLQSEVHVCEADTLQPLWRRTDRRFGRSAWFFQHETPQGSILVSLDNDIEGIDPANGKTLRRVPLVGARYHALNFGPRTNPNGSMILIVECRRKEQEVLHSWLAELEDWWMGDGRASVMYVGAAVDLEAGTVLFKRQLFIDDKLFRFWLGPDARNAIFSYKDRDGQHTIEGWDVPARKPWLWIVGIPLAFGVSAWLARQAWLRRRKRRASAGRVALLPGGQDSASMLE